jgi:hypothetical protein
VSAELCGALRSIVWRFCQQGHDQRRDRRVDLRGQRRRVGHHVLSDQGHRFIGLERQMARQHFVEHDPECVQIGSVIDRQAHRLLRRHVLGCAEHGADLSERVLAH